MRAAVWIIAVVMCGLFVNVSQAAQKDAANQQETARSAMIDQLADRVFKAADGNHNHFLNKTEFATAQGLLEEAVNEWGRNRVIGKPQQANKKTQQKEALATASASASEQKLAKSPKTSPAEFSFYVHSYVDQADVRWQQINAAADAQRKAYNAQRVHASRRGRVPVYPYIPY